MYLARREWLEPGCCNWLDLAPIGLELFGKAGADTNRGVRDIERVPVYVAERKIKKDPRGIQLAMEPIADAMPQLASKKGSRLLIGFAAETNDLDENARDKLKRKRLDLIVANDVTQEGAGFGVDTNIVTLITPDGHAEQHPQMSKDAVADLILDRVAQLRATKSKSTRLRAVR